MEDKKQKKEKKLEYVESDTILGKETDALQKCELERDDFKNKYFRALADYQNLERRVRDERIQLIDNAKTHTILYFLPFLDNLEKAEAFVDDPGLKMIKDQFLRTLEEMGIQEIELMGHEFDPHIAEAIEVVEGEKDNVVVGVIRKGFKLGDHILRVAQVRVSKKVQKN